MFTCKAFLPFLFIALLSITLACSQPNGNSEWAAAQEAIMADLSPEEQTEYLASFSEEEEKTMDPNLFHAAIASPEKTSNMSYQQISNQLQNQNTYGNSRQNPGTRVTLVDHAFGVAIGVVNLPQNWKADHYIFMNRQAGNFIQYKLDYYGPDGSLIRGMAPTTYFQAYGQSFQSTWNQLVRAYVYPVVQQVQFQAMQNSQRLLSAKILSELKASGGRLEGFEQAFSGTYQGRPIDGLLIGAVYQGSFVLSYAVISPKGKLQHTLSVFNYIDRNFEPNLEYDRAIQANQYNNTIAHNNRMNQLNNRIRQHRNELWEMQDRKHEDFRRRHIYEEGLGENGSRHTTNDRVTDAVRSEMTIENPYTGEQERVDQNFSYWYVHPNGQRYGTNDINFNPATLGYGWQRANPVANY